MAKDQVTFDFGKGRSATWVYGYCVDTSYNILGWSLSLLKVMKIPIESTALNATHHARLILVRAMSPSKNPKKNRPQIATIKLGLRAGDPMRPRDPVPLLVQKGGGL